ncbi:Glycosyl transferase family 2 [Ruegeria halocynthiae]|uniref:Glycosyl transferase family 2 n=1 Tax=Ruegeria halocynthiae TaxID=985054 RepID=A0A1H2UTF6_9RHOB|nr:glycosyltransferase family 2 protein [Ruegeria halocynthiae]SDW59386.1 Glycosyl transferase family 2 [Ruegeria halocynthiae]
MIDRIVVYTTMKNEGPFMIDWVAYYLSLGVDHFLIYTNNCDDGTDLIAKRLEDLGVATHIDNTVRPGQSPQNTMLRRVRRHPRFMDADWTFCLDVDEYLNIRLPNPSLHNLLEKLQDTAAGPFDVASFAWKIFGCGGVEDFIDAPVTEQFFLCDTEQGFYSGVAGGLKSITRNNGLFTRYGPHRPKGVAPERMAEIRWVDGGGQLLDPEAVSWRAKAGYRHDFARLHHYVTRSIGSFLVKRDRGKTNHIHDDQAETYWHNMNANLVEDRSILPLWRQALIEKERLMADDCLASLHVRACSWHERKITDLYQRPDWKEFREFLYRFRTGRPAR